LKDNPELAEFLCQSRGDQEAMIENLKLKLLEDNGIIGVDESMQIDHTQDVNESQISFLRTPPPLDSPKYKKTNENRNMELMSLRSSRSLITKPLKKQNNEETKQNKEVIVGEQ
jgi:hypothetical protein